MKLKLPDVTLVMMDCTCPELAELALRDTLDLIVPERTIWVSNKEPVYSWYDKLHYIDWIYVDKWNTVQDYCEFLWYKLDTVIWTKFFLNIQWDGWVIDASQWDNAFLDYDYIGAPWWYDNGLNVGNGTGIRSVRLMRFLAEHRDLFPVEGKEDELLCRVYSPTLEKHGFRWAPEKLASKFSMECTRPSVSSKHFMFHDSFNFPAVLNAEKYQERLRLMQQNKYIKGGKKLHELQYGRAAMILDRLAQQD